MAVFGQLHSLRSLTLGKVASEFDTPSSVLLAIRFPLTHLTLNGSFTLLPLRTLVEHLNFSLQSLTLSLYFWGLITSPLLVTPLTLPHLHSLPLDNSDVVSRRSLVTAFDETPLRSIHFNISLRKGGEK